MVKNEPLPKKDFCARKTDRPSRQPETEKVEWDGVSELTKGRIV